MGNNIQSLQEENHQNEWTIQSLMLKIETMEAQMALFQETVGKVSPPRIKVDLTQEEEDGGICGPMVLVTPIFLAPKSVDPPSENGEETESLLAVWEVLSGIEGLVEEWNQVKDVMEKSVTGGPWGLKI